MTTVSSVPARAAEALKPLGIPFLATLVAIGLDRADRRRRRTTR